MGWYYCMNGSDSDPLCLCYHQERLGNALVAFQQKLESSDTARLGTNGESELGRKTPPKPVLVDRHQHLV